MGMPAAANPDDDLYGDAFDAGTDSDAAAAASAPSKRKRADDGDAKVESKRAAKRKRAKKASDVDDDALDVDSGVNQAIAHMDSRLLADHIAQRTKRFRPDASLVELEDLHVPEQAVLDTTSWGAARTSEQLAPFMEAFAGARRTKKKGQKLRDASRVNGCPHTLVVAGAGQRAADLTRDLKSLRTRDAMVMKLFAKHIKLKDAVKMVKETRMNIGVGTPQRILDLLSDGALSVDELERVVIDASHIDLKKRGIMDMKETQFPLIELLTKLELKERYGKSQDDGRIELLFF